MTSRRARVLPAFASMARGVTYVEMMVVVMVMGILTMVILPTARTARRRIREKELKRALLQVRTALDAYHQDWQKGCIEAEDEYGWPESLEELTTGVERSAEGACARPGRPSAAPTGGLARKPEPELEIYLKKIPTDPFNLDDQGDVSGWRARSYEDDPDDTSWGGDGIYDVRSTSTARALDGTFYEDW